jgi:hypothetical protein
MDATYEETQQEQELATLFYSFRLAHFNQRYYAARLKNLKRWSTAFQILVALCTAASFGVLSFANFPKADPKITIVAAVLALIAFLASVAAPALQLERKIDELSNRICAFHYAAQQLEKALRFVKNCPAGREAEISGWASSAEAAYHQAAALPDTESDDIELRKKIETEINESFPSSYIWTAI